MVLSKCPLTGKEIKNFASCSSFKNEKKSIIPAYHYNIILNSQKYQIHLCEQSLPFFYALEQNQISNDHKYFLDNKHLLLGSFLQNDFFSKHILLH